MCCATLSLHAQERQITIHPDRLIPIEFLGESRPLIDICNEQVPEEVRTGPPIERADRENEMEERRVNPRINPHALPQGGDPALQTSQPNHFQEDRGLDLSVDGELNTPVNPSDVNADVGPNNVIQMINNSSSSYFHVYNKSLGSLASHALLSSLTGVAGGGDPVVLYDALADRWLMSEFNSTGANRFFVAVSTTNDPLGTWFTYTYTLTQFPDYPKYAVWNNMYIVTSNESTPAIYALPRANMLAGTAGTIVRFSVPSEPTIGFQACTPVNFSGGTAPPAGAPGMFMRMTDDGWGAGLTDRLEMWTINYNSTTPASSTINGPTNLATSAFDSNLCSYNTLNCIPMPGGGTMDPIIQVLMNRIQYRNIGGYEAIACDHSVDVANNDHAGIRWYELHRTGGIANPWSIYQQGTYAPDAAHRWMGAIAINNNGDIGLAYNVSSSTVYPSIRYTGRYVSDPLGQMTFAETIVVAGSAANSSNRWGDYNSLDVDPSDGTSFYGTACYNPTTSWRTRLFKFSFPVIGCTAPTCSTAITDNCGASTFNVSLTIGSNGDAPNYDAYVAVNGGANTFNSTHTPGTYTIGTYAWGSSVVVQVRHNVNAVCNQTLAAVTSTGTSCCTAPAAVATGTCIGTTNYNVSVNLTSMGSATSIDIQIDPDAGGALPPVTVQTVTATGTYGPFGNYTSGSPVNVILVHNLFTLCNLTVSNFVKNCNSPGAGCGLFANNTSTPIADVATTTSTIVVPSQGGTTISDLNVYVNISHTYTSDLRLSLKSPANTTIALINTGLCTSSDNIIVEFDQTGANGAIGSVCPMNNLFSIPAASLAGFNGQVLQGTWTLTVQDVAAGDVGTINSWCLIPTLNPVKVSPKIFLEGPYVQSAGMMQDSLRVHSLIPLTEPYTGLGYTHTGGGGGETTTAPVLAVTGNNAIVDWALVELRDPVNSTTIVASHAALLQRDGDVVGTDGVSPVQFNKLFGNYYVAVRHRNHFGVMTLGTIAVNGTTTTVNFTSLATATYGTAARKDISGTQVLWAGNVIWDTSISYTGANNDRDPILVRIGGVVPTNTVSGYYSEDVNMTGVVMYTGAGNDRDPILVNIGGIVPTSTISQQLP